MAENQENRSGEDLSEEASPYRLEEYRRKGMVSQSREVSGLVALLAAGVTTYALSPQLGRQISDFMKEVFRTDLSSRYDLGSTAIVHSFFMKGLHIALTGAFPICLAGFLAGIIASFAQIGPVFSAEPLSPDLAKIDPIAGFKRLVSAKQAIDGLRLVLKTAAVVLVAYLLVKMEVLRSPMHMTDEFGTLLKAYGSAAKGIFLALVGVLSLFAAIDFGLQRFEFMKKLRTTRQEAKQEHKEREGDPAVKARIRSIQREVARRRMMAAVKKADVVITNPTHIAIALVYARDSMSAPKVVAKGADFVAQKIKQIAAEAGIPMVENVPLARTLYKTVKINQAIPRALYQAVAEVLAYVYRLRKREF